MPRPIWTVLLWLPAFAATVPADITQVRPGPIKVVATTQSLAVQWKDEADHSWTADFSLDPAQPLIRSIASNGAAILERARPFYQCETGKRRGGWDVFFDFPPSHPDGIRAFNGEFQLRSARARSIGDRVEVAFDGLRMGPFQGSVQFVFFPGSRLIQQVAILATQEPDTAYFYNAGLSFSSDADRRPGGNMESHVSYFDTGGQFRTVVSGGPERHPVEVRYRAIAAQTAHGGIAVFPAPHQYFFPRDYTTNLGYVWHHAWRGSIGLGIRQWADDATPFYPWSNAPPGTEQRMSVFLLPGTESPRNVLDDVLRYTHADRFPALPGYKTFAPHWHFAYTEQAVAKGFDWTPPFKTVLQDMGVNAAMIMDFHGDGHPQDTSELRLRELDAFYRACRTQSNGDFLLIPAEEANVYFGGHWAVAFPKPVFWYMRRQASQSFRGTDATYGTVYRAGDEKDLLDLVRAENGFVYQTHPRTKGSTGYPDKIRDTEHYRDPLFFGAGWKALPSDLSSPRLGERAFRLLDDMNNWGLPKRLVGEVDVFQIDSTHELYSHMNVNYVRLPDLPSFDNYGRLLDAIRRGDFFTTTGEVLLPEVHIGPSANGGIAVKARINHTFPLEFAEVVWGDGSESHRKLFPLIDTRVTGDYSFASEVDAPGWKWARFAVWDVAADGAFVNPVWKATRPASSAKVEAVIQTAIELAREQGKRVLIRYSSASTFAPLKDPAFIPVNVTDPGAAALAIVLDGDGALVDSQTGDNLEPLKKRSAPVPPKATELLRSALETARAQGKRVILDFRADWCAPCLRLDRFLHDPEVAAVLRPDFVIVSVDLEYAVGARELAYKLGSIENDGLPWTAILEPDGTVLATSDLGKRNIGYPTQQDREPFLQMFAATAKRASSSQILSLRNKL